MLGKKNAQMFDLMFDILLEIHAESATRRQLSDKLGVSPQVIGRQVQLLREKFHVGIESSHKTGYRLTDWGIFDETMFFECKKHRYDARREKK